MRLSGETCKEISSKGLPGAGRRRKCYGMAVLATENTKANTMKLLKLPHTSPTLQFLRSHAGALAGQLGEVPRPSPLTTKPNTPKTNIRKAVIADPSIAIQLYKPRPTGSSVKEAHIANLSLSIGEQTTLTSLLCGHVVQADGFSARALRAQRGSATVVTLLQRNSLWPKFESKLCEKTPTCTDQCRGHDDRSNCRQDCRSTPATSEHIHSTLPYKSNQHRTHDLTACYHAKIHGHLLTLLSKVALHAVAPDRCAVQHSATSKISSAVSKPANETPQERAPMNFIRIWRLGKHIREASLTIGAYQARHSHCTNLHPLTTNLVHMLKHRARNAVWKWMGPRGHSTKPSWHTRLQGQEVWQRLRNHTILHNAQRTTCTSHSAKFRFSVSSRNNDKTSEMTQQIAQLTTNCL